MMCKTSTLDSDNVLSRSRLEGALSGILPRREHRWTAWTPDCSSCSPPSPGWACSRPAAGSGSPEAPSRPGSTSSRRPGWSAGWGPDIDPAALGYPVTAFVTLGIRQPRGHDPMAERLAAIPEVLEVHTITGSGDLLCRVVARSNADLQRVIDAIVDVEGVERTSTVIALATLVPYRAQPLVGSATR